MWHGPQEWPAFWRESWIEVNNPSLMLKSGFTPRQIQVARENIIQNLDQNALKILSIGARINKVGVETREKVDTMMEVSTPADAHEPRSKTRKRRERKKRVWEKWKGQQ